jgi:methionyl-tRNA synthetase
MEPWHLVKNDKEKCGTVLNLLASAIRILASLYYPIIPIKTQELFEMMGMQGELKDSGWIKPEISDMSGKKLNNVKTLFNKIDDKEIDKVIDDFNKRMEGISKTKMETPQEEALITIDDFKKVKLKVARVISAEKLEKSKKLLKLQIEVGEEKRQLIAGVAEYYQPEDLVGKNIIVVANLQPAKLMGELSQGMMLAAKNADDGLCFLTTEKNMKSGSDVS